jgi:hypothetical protein
MADAASGNTASSLQDSVLPKNLKTVYIERKNPDDGKTYSGDFTIRRMPIAVQGQVGAEISRLNGGLQVDSTTEFINTMLAHFKYAITKAPEWWNPQESFDVKLLREVFEAIMAHEQSFQRAPDGQAQAAGQAG